MTEQAPRTTGSQPPKMPRWVKLVALIVGVLVLVFLVLQVTGLAGDHGPGRHSSGMAPAPVPHAGEPTPVAATA